MFLNILMALSLMMSGFILYALFYYIKQQHWNGYANVQKMLVAFAILFIISALLMIVPEITTMLKAITGLDMNIENSKPGFVTFGVSLSALLSSKAIIKGSTKAPYSAPSDSTANSDAADD